MANRCFQYTFHLLPLTFSSMIIHFGYEKKQVLQALRYHFISRPEIKILLIVVNVFALASALMFAFKWIQALSFLIFSLLWFMLILTVWRILPASIYKRQLTFQDRFSMRFEDEGVELSTEKGSKAWPWAAFSTFVESPYFFHLYFDARSFFLVPKDAFEDINQLQQVRQLMKERIKK
jgi:hypothetical protein